MARTNDTKADLEFKGMLEGMSKEARERIFLMAVRLYGKKKKEMDLLKTKHNGSGRRVLSESLVKHIRTLLATGQSSASIARQFNVSKGCILHLKNGKTWKWLE